MIDYSNFLSIHIKNFEEFKKNIEKKYFGLLNYCVTKNSKTKYSFEFEWNILNAHKNDKIWHDDISSLSSVFLNETELTISDLENKVVLDAGCGHGIMTTRIAELSKNAIGVELSKAVEKAYQNNNSINAWYIQADIQFLPFADVTFDTLYSSGVIHHTNNTELALSLIESTLKKDGKICLWLYHPQKSLIHKVILLLRSITKRLPFKLTLIFIIFFIFPVSFLIKKIKNKRPINIREEIIDLLDGFTPEFRFEIPHDLATIWLQKRKYANIKITTTNQFGFSIVGYKK
ncbi:MAG: class I SAM-dependent methyltransferase [Bacteroidetes bacterium]|nr:class I SAM-dependent methyltransferase [Bacteroidota bacterium]